MRDTTRNRLQRCSLAVILAGSLLASIAPAVAADPIAEDTFGAELSASITASGVFAPKTTLVTVSHEQDDSGRPVLRTSTVNPDGSLVAVWGFPDIRYDFRCTSPARCWVRSGGQRWQQMSPNAISRSPVLRREGSLLNPQPALGRVYDITRAGTTTTFTATGPGGPFIYRETITVAPRRLTLRMTVISADPATDAAREDVMFTTTFRSLAKPVPMTPPTDLRPGRPQQDSFSVYANPGGAR